MERGELQAERPGAPRSGSSEISTDTMNANRPPALPSAIDKLNSWQRYRLALLVAPSGTGKTALLRNWARRLKNSGMADPQEVESPPQVAWFDLGPEDDDPGKFLAGLVSALRAAGLQAAIPLSPFSTPVESVLGFEIGLVELANALARSPGELILVLDHYDQVHTPEIHAAISLLLDYLPPQAHLVIASREEPPLPLPRLRARRQMIDIL